MSLKIKKATFFRFDNLSDAYAHILSDMSIVEKS